MELRLENLSMSYQRNQVFAVKDLSYTFTEGVYGLLGPNGAGKTTLMNLIVGNLKPTEGRLFLDGEDIHSLGSRYRALLGYMPQMQSMYDDFTGERFLWYMAGLKGMKKKEAKKKIDELFEVVNLKNDRYKKIRSFSGGMKQRLLIAQALLNDPKILILDEPTAGLDPQERIRIRNFISTISGNRIVLLATHIVSDVESIAKETLFMKKGEFIVSGSPAETLKQMEGKVWEVTETPEKEPGSGSENSLTSGSEDSLASGSEENQTFGISGTLGSSLISNVNRTAEGILCRIVSDEKPSETARSVRPTMEDLYLYLMREKPAAEEAVKDKSPS